MGVASGIYFCYPLHTEAGVLVTLGRGDTRMLVITRREGEEVVIGDPANPIGIVRIASIKGDRVRVAFEFPREISVHRKEVAEQILADARGGSTEKVVIEVVRPGDQSADRSNTTTNGRHPHTTAGRHADAASRAH